MKEDITTQETIELFHNMQVRHWEKVRELNQIIEEQRHMIDNLFRVIEDRNKGYEMLYRRYLELKYPKTDDEG